MLTITVNTNKEEIIPYCREVKIPFNKGLYLYQAKDKGELLGAGLFEIGADQVQVLYYTSVPEEEHFLLDGVLRAGFNYAAEQGISTGKIPEHFRGEHMNYFAKLNYPNEAEFNIENFFSKYKNCL